jgi:hypothetical protein
MNIGLGLYCFGGSNEMFDLITGREAQVERAAMAPQRGAWRWALLSARARRVLDANRDRFGRYQLNLLTGYESVSGSTLQGKARRYGAVYRRHCAAAMGRCEDLGLCVLVARGAHGRLVLVIA